jgi:predicted membrane protein
MKDMDSKGGGVRRHRSDNKALIGIIIIILGSALLLDRLDYVFFPVWIFTWPMILIVVGFVIGARKGFAGIGWLIMILVGTFFLVQHHMPFDWQMREYLFPVMIIIVGVFILFRAVTSPGRHRPRNHAGADPYHTGEEHGSGEQAAGEKKNSTPSGEDYIDSTTVFGSTKKKIFSKNFKGGDTFNMFGSTELDLTQADIDKQAFLDITQIFGGVTLIVPANWEIRSELVAILGGINDKRTKTSQAGESNKVLVIDGTCIFGGIEIKSY